MRSRVTSATDRTGATLYDYSQLSVELSKDVTGRFAYNHPPSFLSEQIPDRVCVDVCRVILFNERIAGRDETQELSFTVCRYRKNKKINKIN